MPAITFTPNRQCGECYACCVYLGIDELSKWPTQTCKNLDGQLGACSRCSVYDTRPKPCALYSCAWKGGLLDDEGRPDKSGILISYYEGKDDKHEASIIVIDRVKATKEYKWLDAAIQFLLATNLNVKIVDFNDKKVVEFTDGKIYEGKLLKGTTPEDLSYERNDNPIATYNLQDQG